MLHLLTSPHISFVDEWNGADEQRLKQAISVLLDLDASVTRAYLVRASNDGMTFGMVLGLLTRDRKESGKLAHQMDRAFGILLNTKAHLDIVFLDDEGDARFRESCAPFYRQHAPFH